MTDDADVVDAGDIEIFAFSQGDLASRDVSQSLAVEFSYGIAAGVEVDAAFAFGREVGDGAEHLGMDAAEFSLNLRIREQDGWRPAVVFEPSLALSLGRGPFARECPCAAALTWLQWGIGPWTISGGGGLRDGFGPGGAPGWLAGAALTRRLSPALSAGIELYRFGPEALGEDRYDGLNAGVVYDVDHHVVIGAALGFGFDARVARRLSYRLTIGWQT